ncbi:hypothetical protein DFH06DRAFT_571923 [Mycena polygramma]|nr:hypothetical protein DFH06DRAFT_571923 [Mycena polygramma]
MLSPAALRDDQMRVQERLDAVKYPVLTLPNEIVSEIFLHFLPIYPLCPALAGLLTPTTLSHICSRWREIALANPSLWSAMSFSDGNHEPSFKQELQLSAIWLRRSQAHPLSIVINDHCWRTSEVFKVIVPHRARWEQIKFRTPPSVLDSVVGPVPLLRHLDMNLWDDAFPLVEMLDAPRLRTVVLSEFGFANVVLPWVQLTGLTLDCVDPDVYRPVLSQTLNLRQLELNTMFLQDDDYYTPRHEFTLAFLESLTMNDSETSSDSRPTRIPDIFIVPALRRLRIQESFLEMDPVNVLRSFISTAGCKLQSVHITERRLAASDSYREAFPAVEFSFDDGFVLAPDKEDSNSSEEG